MIKIMKYGELSPDEIFARSTAVSDVSGIVDNIIADVRERGDKALFEYSEKFDKAKLDSLEVTKEEIDEALAATEPEFLEILKNAAENIRNFHSKQVRNGYISESENGVITGQKITQIEKVGLYVPGGTAAYPSTVLMDAIPALIAGCPYVCIVTPPQQNGKINPAILAAASVAGVTKIFKLGGAQAIAALAYGSETVPAVDKIVGPGNAFVAQAKRAVFGKVSIDMIAGPSEILVVASGNNNPTVVAADLLSQAEHDKMASAVLVTDDYEFAKKVSEALEQRIPLLPRRDIARASIDTNGKIIVADNLSDVIDIANEIAPEHLELMVDNPFDYLGKIKNAGSVFLGKNTPEAVGDYFAGPNHTLPTSGTARFSSPLSVDDFIKKTQFIYYSEESFKSAGDKITCFAEKEGLRAHAESITVRLGSDKK